MYQYLIIQISFIEKVILASFANGCKHFYMNNKDKITRADL